MSGEPPSRIARDRDTGVAFRLQGRRLTVSVPPEARDDLLDKPLEFFCGRPEEYGTFAVSARAKGRVPASTRKTTVRLTEDVSRDLGFCGVEGEAGESFGFFRPPDELTGATQRRLEELERRGTEDDR